MLSFIANHYDDGYCNKLAVEMLLLSLQVGLISKFLCLGCLVKPAKLFDVNISAIKSVRHSIFMCACISL